MYLNPVMWSIYSLAICQLGSFTGQYITTLTGAVMSVPQYLASTFQWHTYMEGPIVAILLAFILACCAGSIVCLQRFNFQRR